MEDNARNRPDGQPQGAIEPSVHHIWKVLVKGFSPMERQLLNGLVALSRRRPPHLQILSDLDADRAEVAMIDAKDPQAKRWAASAPALARIPVIWVDASSVPDGHISIRRPVQWPTIPILLERALTRAAARLSAGDAPKAAATMPVLVVDDSQPARMHIRRMLEHSGFNVLEADSAAAGLEIALSGAVACVLMDVLMPEVDGYEACRRIKSMKTETRPAPPVVMLTGKSSPFDRIRGKLAGCDAYLAKPVAREDLLAVLFRFISGLTPPAPSNPPGPRLDPNTQEQFT